MSKEDMSTTLNQAIVFTKEAERRACSPCSLPSSLCYKYFLSVGKIKYQFFSLLITHYLLLKKIFLEQTFKYFKRLFIQAVHLKIS